jgi:hypothetical protein
VEFVHFLGHAREIAGIGHPAGNASDLNYLKAVHSEVPCQEAYRILGLLNRPIESLPRQEMPSVSTLKH